MASQFTDEFFEWLYTSEIEHRDKLGASDSLLAGVLTVLSGVGIYYLRFFAVPAESWSILLFRILALMFACAFGTGVVCIIGALWPRDRALVASPEVFQNHVVQLDRYHRHYHREEHVIGQRVDEDVKELLREQFVEAGEINRRLAIKKSNWHVRTKYAIAVAILMIFLNAYPTFRVQQAFSEVQKVDIIEVPNPSEDDSASIKGKR